MFCAEADRAAVLSTAAVTRLVRSCFFMRIPEMKEKLIL
jgi:hypothetical protein